MRSQSRPRNPGLKWPLAVALAAAGVAAGQAANFNSNFASDPGGTALGVAEVEDGVLKLTDLADLPPADPPKPLPQNGSYVLPDFNSGARIQSFNAKFKAAVGGGTSLGAQGFSFVLGNDLGADGATFREGGGASKGLVISFDTIDNDALNNAEGNAPGDAPGIIIKIGGARVAARSFRNIGTYPAGSTAAVFANVEVNLDPDGTLDVTYGGTKVYDNVGIGYTPIAGQFGFGAGTAELTAAIRNNHWIDDVNITTTTVTGGAFVSSRSPAPSGARADTVVSIVVENLASPAVSMTFDGQAVTPSVASAGNTRTITYDPPGLLASGSSHRVELTFDSTKKFAFDFTVDRFATIPATAKVRPGSVSTSSSGFKARVYQTAGPAPISVTQAERLLAGLSGANVADLTGAQGGLFNVATINWDDNGDGVGQFTPDDLIPGYPGLLPDGTAASDSLAIESIAFLDLPAGLVTLGVTSDDGFKMTIGSDPRDVTAPVVGVFEATRGASESVFSFVVEEAGIYGARFVWFESGGDANCELYSINAAGNRILVNDRTAAGHIKAYRDRVGSASPYVSSVKPAPGEVSVNARISLQAVITEDASALNASSIELKIKGVKVNPTVAKSGKLTTISYAHAGAVPEGTYPVTLSYSDGTTVSVSSWSFSTAPGPCENATGPAATGYWLFDSPSLAAKVGSDIAYIDPSLASHYSFGTSGQGAAADVPGINGQTAKFLTIPRNENGTDFKKTGIRVKPGLAPSAGGKNANSWTMVADILWGEGHGFGTILRTHDLNQDNDGDLFWRASDGSYGKGCCSSYDGNTEASKHERNKWARVVLVADMTSTPKRFAKYVNGAKHREDVTGDGANIDGRFSLPSEIFLFNDGDDNEQSTVHVSAIQFREGALTDEEVARLGGPSAAGIPVPAAAAASGIASQWEFNGTLAGKKGDAIQYIDNSLSSHYSFGTSGQGAFADVPSINGQPAQFLAIPRNENGTDFKKTGIRVKPGLAASAGGKNANTWTMVADILWGEGHGFGTLLRTHDLNLDNDGDLFWRASDGSYGKGCCSSYDGNTEASKHERNKWARVVLVADMTSTPKRFAKYVNGAKHREDVTGDGANIDGRYSLPAEIFMFNDGDDNEQSTAYISSLQFRPVALSDQEVAALGGPSASGVPEPQTTSPSIKGHWTFDGNLNAAVGGNAVAYIDPSLSSHYSFGTSGQGAFADIPAIGGRPTQFLSIPRNENGTDFKKTGIRIKPGLGASAGGKNANSWTMVADILWGEGHGFGTILRTHDLNQDNDGDLFWRASDGSYGKGCCSSYDGTTEASRHERNKWARVVLVADMTSTPKRFAKYVNGAKHREDVTGDGANIDGRFSLPAEIFMFNDGDDNEQSSVFINAIQFREGALTDEDVAALGGPSSDGPPLTGAAASACLDIVAPPSVQLFSSAVVEGPYTVAGNAVVNAGSKTITIPTSGQTRFYRVQSGSRTTIKSINVQGANVTVSYE